MNVRFRDIYGQYDCYFINIHDFARVYLCVAAQRVRLTRLYFPANALTRGGTRDRDRTTLRCTSEWPGRYVEPVDTTIVY